MANLLDADKQPITIDAPVPQMIYTDTLDDRTVKLLNKVATNKAPIEVWDSVTDERMVHIVAADHDLKLLEQIGDSEFASILLDIAEWTGLTSLYQLLYARAELIAGDVDVAYPEWGELEKRHYSIPELITLNKFGSRGAVMLASGHPAADWLAAIDALAELVPDDQAADVAALGAKDGMAPQETVQAVQAVLNIGVKTWHLEHAFGSGAMPADLLARYGDELSAHVAKMEQAGLPREQYFGLLRADIPMNVVHGFVNVGKITDPAVIKALYSDGVHPAFMARARAEELPVERWAAVMKPLMSTVAETHYGSGWVSPVSLTLGLYRLEELSQDGIALPLRVAWDGQKMPEALSSEQRRLLAERGVTPMEFLAVFERLPQNHLHSHSYALAQRPVTDEDIESVIEVVGAASDVGTLTVLDRLCLGAINRQGSRRQRLRTTAAELRELVRLAPTEQEALYLGSVADRAQAWIGQLQLWRRFEPETIEFTQMLHDMPEIESFLVWLGAQKVTELFYGKNPIRTEAVRMLTSKNPKGARPSYLHFVVLAEALGRRANGWGGWTDEAFEGSKQLRHQIARFMEAMSIVAREEHLGEQHEIANLKEIEA